MSDQPNESVELDIDEEKVQAWDEVKADYQVDPEDAGADEARAEEPSPGD